MAHELPPLPYDYSALEPYIDEQTMHIHHDKHHAAYVTNLNKTLESAPALQGKSLEDARAARLRRNAVPGMGLHQGRGRVVFHGSLLILASGRSAPLFEATSPRE